MLDRLATKYYAISSKSPHAIERLKDLGYEVKGYRESLEQRGDGESDILKDTRKLEWRINARRKKLEQAQAAATPPVPPTAPTVPPAPPESAPAPVAPPAPMTSVPPIPNVAPLPQTQPMIPVPPAPPTSPSPSAPTGTR